MNAAAMVNHCRFHQTREADAVCLACGSVLSRWWGPTGVPVWCGTCGQSRLIRRQAPPCPYCDRAPAPRVEVGPQADVYA